MAAYLSDDLSLTIAQRISSLPIGTPVIVKDEDGYCYTLSRVQITEIPEGGEEIGSAGATVTRAASCTDGCTAEPTGDTYVKLVPCQNVAAPSPDVYICRRRVNSSLVLRTGTYGCLCQGPTTNTLPDGVTLITSVIGTSPTCCECRGLPTCYGNASPNETVSNGCAQGLGTKTTAGVTTTEIQCCCGQCQTADLRPRLVSLSAQYTYVGTAPSIIKRGENLSATELYACDRLGNPAAGGKCTAIQTVSENYDENDAVVNNQTDVRIVCLRCGWGNATEDGVGGYQLGGFVDPVAFSLGFPGGACTYSRSCSSLTMTFAGTSSRAGSASISLSLDSAGGCGPCGGGS